MSHQYTANAVGPVASRQSHYYCYTCGYYIPPGHGERCGRHRARGRRGEQETWDGSRFQADDSV
ncbi:hypothetical protein VPNG_07418 [Cytospora leucostoma]|uniref:Uncharacterized protein n=1 Tax=Cytospora leucostoma TaxID=1230097 RepID=A0A423WML5_9PEZI|nr:hypothetical protein VPNG_07418 [Cytospora leucostoma]